MSSSDGRRAALAIILGLTAWRVGLLALNRTDLFVDEAQYWLWGQNPDLGYFSKPPLIGWLIRAVTDLAGSDAPFWVRLPAPLLHMLTALVVMRLAAELFDAKTASWAGPVYLTLPFVTVGSALISTDTVMLPFLATALLLYFRLLRAPSALGAVLMGLALGLAVMAKYAGLYFVLGAGLAAVLQRSARLRPRDVLWAACAALVTVAPNIWWNATHGATTLRHTAKLGGWGAGGLQPGHAMTFFASQFAVFGPVLFAVLIWLSAVAVAGRLRGAELTLWLFSVPVVGLMVGQGLASKAYANWAVAAYLTGTVLVVRALRDRRRLLIASQTLHLGFALIVPLMLTAPDAIRLPGGKQLFARYLGLADVSRTVQTVAGAEGVSVIIAQNRDLLADLHYTLRDAGLKIYARPRAGPPENYYQQRLALPAGLNRDAIFVGHGSRAPCPDARALKHWRPGDGAYAGRELTIFRLPAQCLNLTPD